MKSAEIAVILSELPHVQVTLSPGHITIAVPGFDDSVHLPLFRVRTAERITLPGGEPGVGLGIRSGGPKLRPLIITSHAIGFAPAPAADMLDSEIDFGVSNAPDFVTYAEMERDARALARLTKADLAGRNLMGIVGTVLLVRCSKTDNLRTPAHICLLHQWSFIVGNSASSPRLSLYVTNPRRRLAGSQSAIGGS